VSISSAFWSYQIGIGISRKILENLISL
jgi:hypothetical protein